MSATVKAYRELLRTISSTFRGDALALRTARHEARAAFQANRAVSDPAELHQKIVDAKEASSFIKESIVQARRTPMGTYGVTPEQADQLRELAPDHFNRNR